MKECSGCEVVKSAEYFYAVRGLPHGYCRDCRSKMEKERFSRPEVKARVRAYNNREEVKERKKEREAGTPRYTLARARSKALGRRPDVNAISLDYLMGLFVSQAGACAVSGLKMTWTGGRQPTSISIDRIDSSSGYIEGNVRLVCWMVNAFKGNWTDGEMLEMALAIVGNMKPKLRLVS